MPNVLRIIDANANRAREALRVMEEAARFVLNDSELTAELKTLRHDLAAALSATPALEANRDTNGDVGTRITAPTEMTRQSVSDVVLAAGKRLSEALRAIEEYAKTLEAPLAQAAEALRYRGYVLEQRLDRALASGRARQWRLCVLLSQELCPGQDWISIATAAIQAGADCLQLREKSLDAGELLERARRLVVLARPRGVSVIVNDRPDVALLSGADGVHLGQTDLPCRQARRLVGRQLLIGVSTSNIDQARRAIADGADYCGLGPMFPTATKHKPVLAGPTYAGEFVSQFPVVPHLAIGGITPDNAAEVLAAGVRGLAIGSAVCAASDPAAVVRKLLALVAATDSGSTT